MPNKANLRPTQLPQRGAGMPQPQQFTPEQGEQAQLELQNAIREAELPPELLAEIGSWAQRVIEKQVKFSEFQAWLREQGLEESEIPDRADMQELASMVALGQAARSMESAAPTADAGAAIPTTGPISPEQLAGLSAQGTYGDTQLAHINAKEAAVLESMGGTGTINPNTGLPQYGFFSDLWRGIKKIVKKAAPFILPVVAIFAPQLIPAIGSYLGASAALAPVVGTAVISGAATALGGGNLKEVITSAAVGGLGAYLTPVVSGYVNKLTGITDPRVLGPLSSAVFAGGVTAIRGGTVGQILTAAASGAAGNLLGQIAANALDSGRITNRQIVQKTFDDAVFAAADARGLADAGLSREAITKILADTGLSNQVADAAAAAAVSGKSSTDIAVDLSNRFGGLTISGKGKTLYSDARTGADNSIVGGANIKALEGVQKAEDALFVAANGRAVMDDLASRGITGRAAQPTIEQNLVAMGVDPRVAAYTAEGLISGRSDNVIAGGIRIQPTLTDRTIIGEPPKTNITAVTPNAAAQSIDAQGRPVQPTTQPAGQPAAQPAGQPTGQPAAQPAGAGAVTPAVRTYPGGMTADQFADFEFAAADAAQLSAQGIGRTQIAQTLQSTGVDPAIANQMAQYASQGVSAANIANTVAGQYGTSKPVFRPEPVASPAGQPTGQPAGEPAGQPAGAGAAAVAPAEPTYPGGMTADQFADFEFAAADAAQLSAQGIGRSQISQTLQFAGVDPAIANQMAQYASQGISAANIANTVANQYGTSRPVFRPEPVAPPAVEPTADTATTGQRTPADLAREDAEFLAADALGQRDAGLDTTQIRENLQAAGATPEAAIEAAVGATVGLDLPAIADMIQDRIGTETPAFVVPRVDIAAEQAALAEPPRIDITTQDRGPDQGFRIDITGVGDTGTDAAFVAADAFQMAQAGLNATTIELALRYAGVDPLVAADAAQLAESGMPESTIRDAIEQSGADPDDRNNPPIIFVPGVQPPLPGGAVTPVPDQEAVGPYPQPEITEIPEGETLPAPIIDGGLETIEGLYPDGPPTLTPDQVGDIVGVAPVIPQPESETPSPAGPGGTFTPAAPDPSWSQPLQYPGVNPGLVGGAIRPAYATTSPVQSQYYWGRQPYFAYPEDLSLYGTSPFQPQQPWGLQQGFFEQPAGTPPAPVYGSNLQPIAPAQFPTPGQIGGNEPLNQPQGSLQPVTPYEVSPYVMPAAMLPLSQYQLSAQPSYVYNIAPTAAQYSLPAR